MNTRHHHSLNALGVCIALTLAATIGRAEDAPAAAVPPAVEVTAAAPAAGATRERGIVMRVDGHEVEGAEQAEVAARVVDRVVDELQAALARMPEDVRKELDEADMRELRAALGEIRDLREPNRVVVHGGDTHNGTWAEEVASAMAPVMVLFLGPVLIVAIVSFNNRRKRELVHQTIDRVIEQGRDVPAELLEALDKGRHNGRTALSRGMVNMALGLGIGVALYNLSGFDVATLGLIPLCIGLAQIIVWTIEQRPAGIGTAAR